MCLGFRGYRVQGLWFRVRILNTSVIRGFMLGYVSFLRIRKASVPGIRRMFYVAGRRYQSHRISLVGQIGIQTNPRILVWNSPPSYTFHMRIFCIAGTYLILRTRWCLMPDISQTPKLCSSFELLYPLPTYSHIVLLGGVFSIRP